MNQSWEKAKGSTLEYYQHYFPDSKTSVCSEQVLNSKLAGKWEKLLGQLDIAGKKLQQIKQAPSFNWFGDNQKSLTLEFNTLLDETIQLLLADTLSQSCWNKQQQIQLLKRDLQEQITRKRELFIIASIEQQAQLELALKELSEQTIQLQQQEKSIKKEMRMSLKDSGLALNSEQLNLLLARVDAGDIVQMVIVFDAVKQITIQLEKLMQSSSDDLVASKKYYAMYVVLSKMIVYVQDNYLFMIANKYLPGIDNIVNKTKEMQLHTSSLAESADTSRKLIYQHNLNAQSLTIKTAQLYLGHLQQQQAKVKQANIIANKDLLLAENTYDTVQLSFDLLKLIKNSRFSLLKMSKMQLPEIVPLQNIAMEKEYQRLTLVLSSSN
ncbi:MAG: hypothetical protein QM479_08545 [Pseudomonadota bacterium]